MRVSVVALSLLVLVPRQAPLQEPPALLSFSDITLVGAFQVPDPTGDSMDFGTGIALRYRGGTPFLYSTGHNGLVVEYAIPNDATLATAIGRSPTWSVATATQQFGDIYQNAIWDDHDVGFGSLCGGGPTYTGLAQCLRPTGLFWDDLDHRLYWMRVGDYDNTTTSGTVNVGYSTLNDTTHTGTGVGAWRVSKPAANGGYNGRWGGQMVNIPAVFAAQLPGGGAKRLGMGPGGYHSIATNGPVSMGPAMFALDPSGFISKTNRDYLSSTVTPLQNHPYSTSGTPLRTLRPGSIPSGRNLQDVDRAWENTATSWGWSDSSQGMVWINGPNKRGILYIAHLFGGDAAMRVQASPAPTHTQFAVAALGADVRVGYFIRLHTDTQARAGHYNFDIAQITAIDTSGAHPVITVANMTTGTDANTPDTTGIPLVNTTADCGQGYQGGGNWASAYWNVALIYDPDDYVKVANGQVSADRVMIKSSGQLPIPGMIQPLSGSNQAGLSTVPGQIRGAVYDPLTHRMFAIYYGGIPGPHTAVVVYQVND